MDDKIRREKEILNLLEQKRKILEINVEKEVANYHQDDILNISEELDDLVINYYRQKDKNNKKDMLNDSK